jgi:hypothetical protein
MPPRDCAEHLRREVAQQAPMVKSGGSAVTRPRLGRT